MSELMSTRTKPLRRPTYPWDDWLTEYEEFSIVRGVDYYCQTHGMVAQIRNAASKRGVSVSIAVEEDTITVTVLD